MQYTKPYYQCNVMLFKKIKWWPLILSEGYLISTFILLWLTPNSSLIENPTKLTLFIVFAYGALALGYWIGLRINKEDAKMRASMLVSKKTIIINAIVFISATHLLLFSLAQFKEYEVLSLDAVISGLGNMGDAYADKFSIYNYQIAKGKSNLVVQLLTIIYFLYYMAWPLTIIAWERLNVFIKMYSILSLMIYVLFYLAIGTQAGIMYAIILICIGILVRCARLLIINPRQGRRFLRRMIVLNFAVLMMFLVFMGISQYSRSTHYGIANRVENDASTMTVSKVIGSKNAAFFLMVIGYPTNGYIGLAYCLDLPFVSCQGRVWSNAIGSYLSQYLGWDNNFDKSYLARSEVKNGWPALMYWSTAFAWIASDITFPGTIVVMLLIGMLMSWAWLKAVNYIDMYAILVGLQVGFFIAYIPANNQIFHSRTGTWAALWTLAFLPIYILRTGFRKPASRGQGPQYPVDRPGKGGAINC